MLIDTHAHLYWESFKEDFDDMLQRALQAGVSTIINVGVDIEKSKEALKQTKEELFNIPGLSVYSTIGIHPHETINYSSDVSIHEDMERLDQIYKSGSDKIVAVGECGLDFFFGNNSGFVPPSISTDQIKTLQKKLFQAHINLAKKLNMPLIVHCRDDRSQNPEKSECWNEVLQMIGDQSAILHCYSGLSPTTHRALQAPNLLISFAATVTYPKNEYLREAVKVLPLEKIVLETDCPFLPPQSKRGQRNEPFSVLEIAQLIADIKDVSLETVTQQTSANAAKLFAF